MHFYVNLVLNLCLSFASSLETPTALRILSEQMYRSTITYSKRDENNKALLRVTYYIFHYSTYFHALIGESFVSSIETSTAFLICSWAGF